MIRSLLVLAVLATLALAPPVAASECATTGDACHLACQSRLGAPDQDAARAGCVARCVTDKAACVAQSAFDDAARAANRDVLPWLDRQTERARSMIDEFLGRNSQSPGESKSRGQQL